MAELPIQKISQAGLNPVFSNASVGGDTFNNASGKVVLHVDNQGASSITVTIDSVKPCDQGFDHDIDVTIPAGETRIIGPFSYDRFSDKATGLAKVNYSDVTSVKVAAISL